MQRPQIGTRFRLAGVGVIGVLAALASGCSAGPGPAAQATGQSPRQAVRLAASTAGQVKSFSATLSLHLTTTDPALGAQSTTLAGTVTEQVKPSLLISADYTTLTAAGQSLPGGMSEIVTPGEIYMKLAMLSQSLHTGKPWIGLPLAALSAGSGLNVSSLLQQLDTSSPLTQARLLAGAKNVKAIGTGTVAGVPVTEYSGTYSMSAALARLPADVRASLGKSFSQAGLDSASTSFRVWIDRSHLVRKQIATLKSSKLSETIVTTVTSINQPVTIAVPPASQVYTLSQSQLGQAGG